MFSFLDTSQSTWWNLYQIKHKCSCQMPDEVPPRWRRKIIHHIPRHYHLKEQEKHIEHSDATKISRDSTFNTNNYYPQKHQLYFSSTPNPSQLIFLNNYVTMCHDAFCLCDPHLTHTTAFWQYFSKPYLSHMNPSLQDGKIFTLVSPLMCRFHK